MKTLGDFIEFLQISPDKISLIKPGTMHTIPFEQCVTFRYSTIQFGAIIVVRNVFDREKRPILRGTFFMKTNTVDHEFIIWLNEQLVIVKLTMV